MYNVKRSALVPFNAGQMYQLVADIPRYPEFLNWCRHTEIVEDNGSEVVALLTIAFRGLHKSFSTSNLMEPDRSIKLSLVDGPFSDLQGTWLFTALEPGASKIELDMAFGFNSSVVDKLVGPVFSHIANHQVDAFCARAQELYGQSEQ